VLLSYLPSNKNYEYRDHLLTSASKQLCLHQILKLPVFTSASGDDFSWVVAS
jgi:hypothetical protein